MILCDPHPISFPLLLSFNSDLILQGTSMDYWIGFQEKLKKFQNHPLKETIISVVQNVI